MGSAHLFFRLDLERLRGLFGSSQDKFAREVLKKQAEDVEDNDLCFEDEINAGTCPDTKTALHEILAGKPTQPRRTSMYGYTLKIICEHIGKQFGEEVGSVRDHPYESQLVRSGPPVPIPYDPGDFPQIGFLALADIQAEIDRLDAAPRILPPPQPVSNDASLAEMMAALKRTEKLSRAVFGTNENLALDMDAYRKTLQEALKKRVDIVSFKH
jgi:hypothetical protein